MAPSMNLPEGLYPWLQDPWQRLLRYRDARRLPQALLIVGRQGLGKRRLAECFAAVLLCQDATAGAACGVCPSCRLLAAETHPDLLIAEPAEPGKPIPVDAIRQVIDKLALKPQYSGHRVVLLAPADALNSASANALLKTLEEPSPGTLLVLVSAMPSRMPATLRSRCQRLAISAPPRAAALAWLQRQQAAADLAPIALSVAQGAPLRALNLIRSGLLEQRSRLLDCWPAFVQQRLEPLQAAEQFASVPAEPLIDWLASWSADVMKLGLIASSQDLANGDREAQLQGAARRLDAGQIQRFLDVLLLRKRQLLDNAQLNRQLLVEEILIDWYRLARGVNLPATPAT